MKKIRKWIACLMAIIIVFGTAAPVFAQDVEYTGADAGTGKITIENANVGSEYKIYKLFDATVTGAGETAKIAYSGTVPTDLATYFTADTAGNITATDAATTTGGDVMSEGLRGALKTWAETATVTAQATSDGTALNFTNLPYGYYVITSTTVDAGVVTVTSTKPTATVIDKNTTPSWPPETTEDPTLGKTILNSDHATDKTLSSVKYGDTVNFQINFDATKYGNGSPVVEYYINDELGAGLTYDQTSLVVKAEGTTNALTAGTDYTVTWDTTAPNNSFKITLNWYDTATETFKGYVQNNLDKTRITVEYSATLNNTAVIADTGNVNTATFDYKTTTDTNAQADGSYHLSSAKTTTTYTYAIGVAKIDGKGSTKTFLPGAKFTLKKGADDIKAVATTTAGVYEYSTATDALTEFEVDASGLLVIKGLDAGTYTLTETVAPAGYNQLTDSIEIILAIDETASYTNSTTHYFDENGNSVADTEPGAIAVTANYSTNVKGTTVVNNAGAELPATGGLGTKLVYTLGVLFLIAAVVIIITRRVLRTKKSY